MNQRNSELESIHKKLLIAYKQFCKVCKKYNLKYYAIGGTAIGAALWKGFIPWDDDMDIAMPVDDFEKLEKIAKKEFKDKIKYISLPWLGGKIYDSSTTIIEASYINRQDRFYGVFIDIVPMVPIPTNNPEPFIEKARRAIIENTAYDRAPGISKYTNMLDPIKMRRELMHECKYDESEYAIDLFADKCSYYSIEGFKEAQELKFEDTTIPVSQKWREDAERFFGHKIIKNVPEDQRPGTHTDSLAFCDLNKPCKNYSDDLAKLELPEWFSKTLEKQQILCSLYYREAKYQYYENLRLNNKIEKLIQDNQQLQKSKAYRIAKMLSKPLSLLRKK